MKRLGIVAVLALPGCTDDTPLLGVRRTLAVGGRHACVIDDAETLRCWGEPIWPVPLTWEGSDERDYVVPPIDVPGGAADVAVGAEWICALARDGMIACWGMDMLELDFLDRDPRTGGVVADVGDPFVDVAAGSAHVCGATGVGDVWCWGENGLGQLGQGHTDEIDGEPPARIDAITLPSPAVEVAAGRDRTCARTRDGDVYCWGDGSASPTFVEVGAVAVQLSVGDHHACAVDEHGALRCWGNVLPSPSTPDILIEHVEPTLLPLDGPVAQASTGGAHSCVLLRGGAAHCWGENEVGQLGLGHVLEQGREDGTSQPPIDAGDTIIGIAAGSGPRTCVRLQGGDVRCWGHTERWTATTDADCIVDVPNPSAGALCEPLTLPAFRCWAGADCCIGDDESPASAVPVPL